MSSKYFTDKAIQDEEWTLEVLERWVRGAQFADEIKASKEAAAEALAAHPNSNEIKAFIEKKGLL